MTQELAIDEKFEFTPTGLIVKGHPTLDECQEAAHYIFHISKMATIWLGDLLNYMEMRWGEKYAQVLDATGFAYSTVANAKNVMGHVSPEVRQDGLYFSHYAAVAALPEPQQKQLLEKAAKKGWNTSDIRLEVKKEKRKKAKEILPVSVKMELALTLYVPENLTDKLRELADSWAKRLASYWEMELIDLKIRRIP